MPPIRRALLSVHDKSGLVPLAAALHARGVELLSTGGTLNALRAHGLPVTAVADLTGFPEILDGRVKTLHPAIHAGLLADRGKQEHLAALAAHGFAPIDLLVVNLYPFRGVIARPVDNYGLPCHLRISIGTEAENARWIEAMHDILRG